MMTRVKFLEDVSFSADGRTTKRYKEGDVADIDSEDTQRINNLVKNNLAIEVKMSADPKVAPTLTLAKK
jgi:hypothetical protein